MSDSIFEKELDLKYTEKLEPTNPEEFQKILNNRRSVRVYQDEQIPDHIVEKCLDMALLAPNSSNLQPWEFYWVVEPTRKRELQKACMDQPAAKTAPALIVCVARTKTWKRMNHQMLAHFKTQKNPPKAVMDYYSKLVPLIYTQGPLGILGFFKWISFSIVGLFRPMPRGPFGKSGMQLWAVKSSALACENLMLAFSAHGYDSCPMEGFDEKRVKDLLDLPSDAVVTMVVSAGKRAINGVYGPRIRFDKSQFVKKV